MGKEARRAQVIDVEIIRQVTEWGCFDVITILRDAHAAVEAAREDTALDQQVLDPSWLRLVRKSAGVVDRSVASAADLVRAQFV